MNKSCSSNKCCNDKKTLMTFYVVLFAIVSILILLFCATVFNYDNNEIIPIQTSTPDCLPTCTPTIVPIFTPTIIPTTKPIELPTIDQIVDTADKN